MQSLRLSFALLFGIILTNPFINGQVQEPETPRIEPSVTIHFGDSIEFSVMIESEMVPVRAALFLRTSSDAPFNFHVVDVAPGKPGKASIQFNPQEINLRPFTLLGYYWQIDFSDGTTITTDPQQVSYLDERFTWQMLSREGLIIYWVEGNLEWVQDIYAIAASVLPEIEKTLAKEMSGTFQIYVYPSQTELQNSLRQAGINQASAHTLPEFGVVLIAGESGPETLIRFEREIPHEIVHLVLYERMGPAISNLPAWLDEGLATRFENAPHQVLSSALQQAVDNGTLIDMETLCVGFPISESDQILAYAQSASFITYLIDVYGTGGINQLLDAYMEGTTCTGGVQRVYQRSLGQLESEWKQITLDYAGLHDEIEATLYIGIAVILILALVIIYWLFSRRRKLMSE